MTAGLQALVRAAQVEDVHRHLLVGQARRDGAPLGLCLEGAPAAAPSPAHSRGEEPAGGGDGGVAEAARAGLEAGVRAAGAP